MKTRVKELENFIRENIVEAMFISKTRLIMKAKEILDVPEDRTTDVEAEQERLPAPPPAGPTDQPR